MARPLRIEYSGAWYHVMNRGLARSPIFLNNKHREIFLELLFEVHNRFGAEIHAYCLMDNHYHLLIRTPFGNISRIMRHLDGVYTQRFNSLIKRDGPLFRGRYKCILIDADVYFLRLTRYIHLNPVKAKLVESPEHYKWSSYKAYLSGKAPNWLSTQHTLSYFNGPVKKKYKAFIDEGIDREINEFYQKLKIMPILGADAFTKIVTETYLKEQHKIDDIPEHKYFMHAQKNVPNLEEVISCVAEFYKIDECEIYKVSKGKYNQPRSIAIYLASAVCQFTYAQISTYFNGMKTSAISKSCLRLEKRLREIKILKDEFEHIKKLVIKFNDMSPVQT